jgi:hypothetical protein
MIIKKGPPPPKQHLASTQDLLSRFHLLPAYNKYVRPSQFPDADPSNDGPPPSTPGVSAVPGTLSKGKGKAPDVDLGDGGDGDDDDVKGEKKKKNTYKHLIKGVPGVLQLFAIFPQFLIYIYIYNRKTLFEKR